MEFNKHFSRKLYVNPLKSLPSAQLSNVVSGQEINLRSLYARQVKGVMPDIVKATYYPEYVEHESIDISKFQNVDIAEREAYIEAHKTQLLNYTEQYEREQEKFRAAAAAEEEANYTKFRERFILEQQAQAQAD